MMGWIDLCGIRIGCHYFVCLWESVLRGLCITGVVVTRTVCLWGCISMRFCDTETACSWSSMLYS